MHRKVLIALFGLVTGPATGPGGPDGSPQPGPHEPRGSTTRLPAILPSEPPHLPLLPPGGVRSQLLPQVWVSAKPMPDTSTSWVPAQCFFKHGCTQARIRKTFLSDDIVDRAGNHIEHA